MNEPRPPRGSSSPVLADPLLALRAAGHDADPPPTLSAPPAARGRPVDAADLDAATGAVLEAVRGLLGVVVRSLGPVLDEVPLPQFRALVLLSALGPTRIGSLAQRLGVHQSTFTRTTDRMVESGLVARAENPGNRREVIVEATEAGLRVVSGVAERRRAEVGELLEQLCPDERALVLGGLGAFARVAGVPEIEEIATLGG